MSVEAWTIPCPHYGELMTISPSILNLSPVAIIIPSALKPMVYKVAKRNGVGVGAEAAHGLGLAGGNAWPYPSNERG